MATIEDLNAQIADLERQRNNPPKNAVILNKVGDYQADIDAQIAKLRGDIAIEEAFSGGDPNQVDLGGLTQEQREQFEQRARTETQLDLQSLFDQEATDLSSARAAEDARRAEAEEFERLLRDDYMISQGLVPADFRVTEAQAELDRLITERDNNIQVVVEGGKARTVVNEDLARQIEAAQAELELQQGRFDTRSAAQTEAQALIDEQANRAIELGTGDIEQGVQRQLEMLREESGASRGLRFTDTPVFDDAQRVSEAGIEQTGRLALGVRQGQAAQALQQSNVETQQGLQFQQFQSQLAQQALANRQSLFGATSGFGLNLLGASPSAQEFRLGLRSTRAPEGPSTTDRLLSGGVSVLAGLATGGYFN
jgi:hypothetical protein